MRRGRTEKILFRGIVAKGVNFAVQFGYAIILTPVLLTSWGVETFGTWLTLISLYSLIMAFDIGHGTYVGTEFNKEFNLEQGGGKAIIGSALRAQYVSGLLQVLIVIVLVKYDVLSSFTETEALVDEVNVAILILIGYRFIVGSARSVLIRIVYPIGYLDRMTYIYIVERVVEMVLVIAVAAAGYSIVAACTALVCVRLTTSILTFVLIKRWMPEYFPWWKEGSLRVGMINYWKGLTLTLSTFVDKLNTDGLNVFINVFVGPLGVSIFATIRTLSNVAIQGVQLVAEPLLPEMTRYQVRMDFAKLLEVIKTYWIVVLSLGCLGLIAALLFIEPLYLIWVRNEIEFDHALYASMVIAVIAVACGRPMVVSIKAANDTRAILLISLLRVSMVLGLGYFLLGQLGLLGVGIAVLASEFLASLVVPAMVVRQAFRRAMASWDTRSLAMAVIVGCLTTASILIWVEALMPVWLNVTVFASMIIVTSVLQWTSLSGEVKERLKNVMS